MLGLTGEHHCCEMQPTRYASASAAHTTDAEFTAAGDGLIASGGAAGALVPRMMHTLPTNRKYDVYVLNDMRQCRLQLISLCLILADKISRQRN